MCAPVSVIMGTCVPILLMFHYFKKELKILAIKLVFTTVFLKAVLGKSFSLVSFYINICFH